MNNLVGAQMALFSESSKLISHSEYMRHTIGVNIDAKIASLKAEIARLEGVKADLAGGKSLLDIKIEDLRAAMNY